MKHTEEGNTTSTQPGSSHNNSDWTLKEQGIYFKMGIGASILLFLLSIGIGSYSMYLHSTFEGAPFLLSGLSCFACSVFSILSAISCFMNYKRVIINKNCNNVHSRIVQTGGAIFIILFLISLSLILVWRKEVIVDYLAKHTDRAFESHESSYASNAKVLGGFLACALFLLGFLTFISGQLNPHKETVRFGIYFFGLLLNGALLATINYARNVLNMEGVEAIRKLAEYSSVRLLLIGSLIFILVIFFTFLFNLKRWKGLYLISGGLILIMGVAAAGCSGRVFKTYNDVNHYFQTDTTCRNFLANFHENDIISFGCQRKYLEKPCPNCKSENWGLMWEKDSVLVNSKRLNQAAPLNMNCCPTISRMYSGQMISLAVASQVTVIFSFVVAAFCLFLASRYSSDHQRNKFPDIIFIAIFVILNIVMIPLIFAAFPSYKPPSPRPYVIDSSSTKNQAEVISITKSENLTNYPMTQSKHIIVCVSLATYITPEIDYRSCITPKCESDALRIALLVKNGRLNLPSSYTSPKLRIYENSLKQTFFPSAQEHVSFIAFEGFKEEIDNFLQSVLTFCPSNPLFGKVPELQKRVEQIDFTKNSTRVHALSFARSQEELRRHFQSKHRRTSPVEPTVKLDGQTISFWKTDALGFKRHYFKNNEIKIEGNQILSGVINTDSAITQRFTGTVFTSSHISPGSYYGLPDVEVCISNDANTCKGLTTARTDGSGNFELGFPILKGKFAYTSWIVFQKKNFVKKAQQIIVGGAGMTEESVDLGLFVMITPDAQPRARDERKAKKAFDRHLISMGKIEEYSPKRTVLGVSKPVVLSKNASNETEKINLLNIIGDKGVQTVDSGEEVLREYQVSQRSYINLKTQEIIDRSNFFGDLQVHITDLDTQEGLNDVELKLYQGKLYCKLRSEPPLRHGKITNKEGFTFFNLIRDTYTIFIYKTGYHTNCFSATVGSVNSLNKAESYIFKHLGKNQLKSVVEWEDSKAPIYLYGAFDVDNSNVCRVSYFEPTCGGLKHKKVTHKKNNIEAITVETLGPYKYIFAVKSLNSLNDNIKEANPHFKLFASELEYPAFEFTALPSIPVDEEANMKKERELAWLLFCINGKSSTQGMSFSDENGLLWRQGQKVMKNGTKVEIPKFRGQEHPNPDLCHFAYEM